MELGIRLPSSGPNASAENIAAAARWAEELGYDSVWLGDHVVFPTNVDSFYPYAEDNRWKSTPDTKVLDPLLVLGWAGAAAPTIKLGTSVLVITMRNPVLLAKRLSTLDYLTGGRVMLGAGVGWMQEEFEIIGAPYAQRGKRGAEMVQLMRELWTGETVDFRGEFWQVSGCQMHPTPTHRRIPVVWGGHSEPALKRVARIGDGWHPTQLTIEQLSAGITKLHQYCDKFGRDPASLIVIARPGSVVELTDETIARYRDLGVHTLVTDPPTRNPGLAGCREEMERVAEIAGLKPRS